MGDLGLNADNLSERSFTQTRSSQLTHDFCFIVVYLNFMKTFQRTACIVTGIKRLQHFIYIICRQDSDESIKSIRVYDDTLPFDLLYLILIEEVNRAEQFVADATLNCFYILDSPCIWKFTIRDQKLTKWLSDLVDPISLTVSTDGQLVVLRRDETWIELEIYESDGSFARRIRLFNSSDNKLRPIYRTFSSINDPLLIVSINNSFLVVSSNINFFERYENFCLAYDFRLFSINSFATNGQLIGQVNHTFSGGINSHWRWQVKGSTVEFNIDLAFSNNYDSYLIVVDNMFRLCQRVRYPFDANT